MNKKIICLMMACLSLFTYPLQLSASSSMELKTETSVPPVLTPAMEKKIDAFKKKHPDMFPKKENKEVSARDSKGSQHVRGIILFLSGTAIIVALILIIIFLL
jgi:hypothetical protein